MPTMPTRSPVFLGHKQSCCEHPHVCPLLNPWEPLGRYSRPSGSVGGTCGFGGPTVLPIFYKGLEPEPLVTMGVLKPIPIDTEAWWLKTQEGNCWVTAGADTSLVRRAALAFTEFLKWSISGATYSGVPQKVHVFFPNPIFFAKPKSTLQREKNKIFQATFD